MPGCLQFSDGFVCGVLVFLNAFVMALVSFPVYVNLSVAKAIITKADKVNSTIIIYENE